MAPTDSKQAIIFALSVCSCHLIKTTGLFVIDLLIICAIFDAIRESSRNTERYVGPMYSIYLNYYSLKSMLLIQLHTLLYLPIL